MSGIPEIARDSLANAPQAWRRVPLKVLTDINSRVLPEDTDPSFEFYYIDIASVDGLGSVTMPDPRRFEGAPSRARRVTMAGDTLVSTVRTYLRAVAPAPTADLPVIASTGFAVLSPRPGVDPAFLRWWLQSAPFIEDVVARSVGVGYPATTATEVGRIMAPCPELNVQRGVARWLDSECGKLDDLVKEHRLQLRLLREHVEAGRDQCISRLVAEAEQTSSAGSVLPRLKQCVDRVTVGIVITPSKWYAPTGVPALRGLNVRPGQVRDDDLVLITEEGHAEHSKSRLERGDVVVVRTGNAGAAAVVPERFVDGNAIDLLIVRPGERMRPAFVELLLNSRFVQDQVTQGAVGALQSHFNTKALKNVRVVVPPLANQDRVVEECRKTADRVAQVEAELRHQMDLLLEHRQAIITAAVTGQLHIVGDAA